LVSNRKEIKVMEESIWGYVIFIIVYAIANLKIESGGK